MHMGKQVHIIDSTTQSTTQSCMAELFKPYTYVKSNCYLHDKYKIINKYGFSEKFYQHMSNVL